MPYTTSDWHNEWIDFEGEDPEIHDGVFVLQTTTHEQYRFDIRTGEIVEEFRMWRMLSRLGIALAAVTGIGLIVILFQRRRPVNLVARAALVNGPSPGLQPTTTISKGLASFSLQTLLVVTTAVAFVIGIGYRWPHIVLLVGSFVFAALLTRRTIRDWRLCRTLGCTRGQRVRLGIHVAFVLLAWPWCYLLSVGPVMGLIHSTGAPDDVRWAIILTVYRPLLWLDVYVGADWFAPLEWYFRAWGLT
jgi:hypothetical protein